MKSRLFWGCIGLTCVGNIPALDRSIKAIVDNKAIEVRATGMDRVIVSQCVGRLVELIFIEMSAQHEPCDVMVHSSHLLQHTCGNICSYEEWTQMMSVERRVRSFLTGDTVRIPSRRCRCGSFISFDEMKIVHIGDMCNSRGGSA